MIKRDTQKTRNQSVNYYMGKKPNPFKLEMKYSNFLNNYSKPILKIGVFLTKSITVFIIVGLILRIMRIGWLTL